jgi:two-component system, LuxR family, sensor kinase FixL
MIRSLLIDQPLALQMLEVSPAAVAITDDSGTIQFVNRNFSHLLGYSSDEIVGHSCTVVLPDTVGCDILPQLARVGRRPGDDNPENQLAVCARGKDGLSRRVVVTVHEVTTSSQALWVFNLFGKDRRLVNRSQLESERLAAVTQMVSGLAHESRNSMQKAVACLDLLELDLEGNRNLMLLAEQIRESLAELLKNYDEVRQYAEPIRLRLEPANLMSLCRAAFDEMSLRHSVFPHQLDLMAARDVELTGMFDPTRMRSVFSRLLDNAIDAANGVAKIEGTYSRVWVKNRDAVVFELHDYGHGFSEQSIERAFEPFYTTKQHGSGLGLPTCRRIVEAHDGNISVANHPSGGAVVRMTIPLHPGR